jgi:tryptophan-rich sensory protein
MKKLTITDWPILAGSIIICLFIGFAGGLLTAPSVQTWYDSLNKPIFAPPNWLFGPIWTALYILMGIALFLVLREGIKTENVPIASNYFGFQLFLNFLWSLVFFNLRSIAGGVVVISALWIAIMMTIIRFNKTSREAAWLMIPYIVWVTIATLLNVSLMLMNP